MLKLKYDKTIYIVSWTCGAGKSTIAHALAETYESSAHINADHIYNMIVGGHVMPWEDAEKKYLKLLRTNIQALSSNFISQWITPVIDYVVSPHNLHYVQELQKKHDIIIKYAVLMADEQTLLARDAQRAPEDVMRSRVIELLHKFQERNIDPRFMIDTSHKTVEEVVWEIINGDRFIV